MGYKKDVVKGFSWVGFYRITNRVVVVVRTAILARILTPSQFGVFGIATLLLSFLEIFTETGINTVLIQEKSNIKKYIDTAWVISIIRGTLMSGVIFLVAPLISNFFNAPDSLRLIRLISIAPLIKGFINPSEIVFQKELQFNKDFWLRSSVFLSESVIAIIYALITRTADSLVWGLIAGAVAEVVITNVFIRPRPKLMFDKKKVRSIFNRGKWVTLAGIFTYFTQEGDDMVVARVLNESFLGLYQVAYKISTLPLTEIAEVAHKVSFPIYTKIIHDPKRLRKAFLRLTVILTLLIVPLGITIYAYPDLIIKILLGDNWLAAADVLRVLAVFGVIRAITALPNPLFLAIGKQEWAAKVHFTRLVGLAVTIVPLTIKYGIVGAGISTIISVLFSVPISLFYLRKAVNYG